MAECRHQFIRRVDADGPFRHCVICREDFDYPEVGLVAEALNEKAQSPEPRKRRRV